MLTFTKELITNHAQVREAYSELNQRRNTFNIDQKCMAEKYNLTGNQAALISKDYWREVEAITTRVIRNDEGRGLLADLMTMATPISIGKTAALYRMSSDAGKVTRSMSGQVPEEMDNVLYKTEGDLIPIFKTGYGRGWREWLGMQTEGLDALADDQEAATAAIMKDMANYCLFGDAKIKSGDYECKGLTNHKNVQKITSGTPAISSDNDAWVAWYTGDFAKQLDNQYIDSKIKMWVSPEIMRRLEVPLSTAQGYKGGTLKEEILRFGRVESFNQTFLLQGNKQVGYVKDGMFIRPRVAAQVGTYMESRSNAHDDYNTMVWSAMGLQIKTDYNGKKKAFYITGA